MNHIRSVFMAALLFSMPHVAQAVSSKKVLSPQISILTTYFNLPQPVVKESEIESDAKYVQIEVRESVMTYEPKLQKIGACQKKKNGAV